ELRRPRQLFQAAPVLRAAQVRQPLTHGGAVPLRLRRFLPTERRQRDEAGGRRTTDGGRWTTDGRVRRRLAVCRLPSVVCRPPSPGTACLLLFAQGWLLHWLQTSGGTSSSW